MLKYGMLLVIALTLTSTSAQSIDSMAIKQVDSLILVSRDLTAKRNFDQALKVNVAAENLALEKFGHESAAYGSCTFNRGRINAVRGDYQEAEKWYLKSQSIREKVLGKEHPDYGWILNNLGTLYLLKGNYEKAEPFFLEAKTILKKVRGVEHSEYATSVDNLAVLYSYMGIYEKAGPLFLEAKVIRQKVLGVEHPEYAKSLNNLATHYLYTGNYEKAEPLYLEASDIWGKKLGKEHPDYASSLDNLAALYWKMGNYKNAEPLYLQAKEIREKVYGKEHPDYGNSLNNLAIHYFKMANYEKSETLYLEAKAISEKVQGVGHPDYASSINNLANFYKYRGIFEKAEPLYLESITIREKVLGKEHPEYTYSLDNLAVLYAYMGNYEKAEPLFLEAKAIQEKMIGEEHPEYTNSLINLADLYERKSLYYNADDLLEAALVHSQSRLLKATSFLSVEELANYAVLFQNKDMLSAYLLARQINEAPPGKLPILAYNHVLFYKGFLLSAASRLNAPSMLSPETMDIDLLLKGYRRRLSEEYTKPIARRKSIAELEQKANEAEKELARSVAGYAEALRQVKWQEVQAALPASAMALEFNHFRFNFPQNTDSVMYAALVLLPGANQPLFIPLFEEKEFDHLLSADRERKADYVNDLYAWADRGMVKLGSEKKSLYELIWAKIEATGLEGIKTVYYSPSGVLHRINLGAIAVDDETILSDRYNLVALNSTRQLVLPSAVNTLANDALLLGAVNFEVDTIHTTFKEQALLTSRSAADASTASGTRGGNWSSLKWTEKEVERIATTLSTGGYKAAQLTGWEATEEAIKAIGKDASSPRVLHIATHGFFFPDPEINIQKQGLGETEPVFKSSDNPMIRSGLILAGGNYAWQHGRAVSPNKEDGILTAYEISQMNLSNTELIVLSACETGLGDIQGNEGVYGLQRAFKIAGAKYLIMSLWQVPDRETMEFMTTFYKNWLEEKLTIPDAFRKTQREMRDRFFNPYSWGAFVLVE